MCPHATTTTVAFLYGEDPGSVSGSQDDLGHAAHVAECPDCAAVAAEHAAVMAAIAPVLPALRDRSVPGGLAGPAAAADPAPGQTGRRSIRAVTGAAPAGRRRWVAAAALAAAAVVLVAVGLGWPADPAPEVPPAPALAGPLPPDLFDAAIDDLDLEVASLELELL